MPDITPERWGDVYDRAFPQVYFVYAPQAPGANMSDYTLVPLTGGSPITFKEVNGLLASVRLR